IQDMVEDQLMAKGAFELARRYVRYRYNRSLVRKANTTDNRILSLIECNNEEVKQENSNKNPTVNSVQRDYMAGEVSRDLTRRMLLSPDIVEADKQGLIHFHDSDYFAQHMHNCDLVNLEDMLQNGTVISDTLIEKPHSFSTACNIATQIIAQVASNQYGGQSISLTHLAPFVQISREKIRKETLAEIEEMGVEISEEKIHQIVEERLRKEVNRGVQTIQYQVVTLLTTNGQAPFVTVYMYLNEAENEQQKADLALIIEETLKQRYQGVKNEAGVWITPAFPKLIYVLEEDNVTEGSKYWYLTELAAKCTAKRMVPDYISEKVMLELKGDVYTCMGCRSFLTPDRFTDAGVGNIANAGNYVEGKHKYYGRFNQGVVTVNLVDIGLSANRDMDKFWKIFDERMDLCHRALKARHERLKGTLSDAAPILWQYGALARLKKGETIDKLLYGGYSTISLGYAGLWECVYSLIGKKLTEEEGKELGLEIMKALNAACAKWKAEENIDYSIYGTPLESTTYKFAKCLQKRFGIIKGVTDRNYITNSYHVHVTEDINAFDKLKLESEFQALSPGGAISYVEVPNMQDNIPAVLQVMKFIYENIMYAELNTKSDYCQVCGYDGEIAIVEEDGKLLWECPNCHNRDQDKMNVARRTCGYIGTQFWNQGRTQEIQERVLHL
ncbi:MAG: anaerobic ribonucleoside-triphosphate reductase, partial [Ruminococcus sp.]|nr:anaerobic ribonucleoside-triphosphate reductase [Ruminococcus sp.]